MGARKPDNPEDAQIDELCSLDSEESRRAYLKERTELISAETIERLAEAVRQRVRVNVEEALRAGEAALIIAEATGDGECFGRALRAKANALWFKGQCRPAVELLDRAVELFEHAGRSAEVGRTLSTSIQPLILIGEYERALRNSGRAREIFTQENDTHRLARLEINVANIHHRQERFAEALASYEHAYQELAPHGDIEAIAVALHNMAVCLISLNDFHRALDVYQNARAFFLLHSMPLLVSQADYNIAYLYHLRGDYERALEGLRATREACSEADPYHAALCDLDQSEIYLELNMAEEAAQMAGQAAEQFEKMDMRYEAARSMTNLAVATYQKGKTARAIEYFGRAKEMFSKESHRAGQALIDLYQAMLLVEAGEVAAAKALCSGAREFFRSLGLSRKAVLCDLLLARVALAERDLHTAGECCYAALDQLAGLEAPVLTYQAQFLLGQLHDALGDPQGSLKAYNAARRELEAVRSSLQGEELKISFIANKLEVYEELIRICLRSGLTGPPAEEAFGYIEQAKCRSLVEAIFGRAQPLRARVIADHRLDSEILRLRSELNWFYHRIDLEQLNEQGVTPERIENLWAQARECENSLLRAEREMPATAGDRPMRNPAAVTLPQIRAALGDDRVLIEYFLVHGQVLGVVLSSERLDVVPLAPLSRIRDRVRMLQFQLSKFRLGQSYTDRAEKALAAATERHLRGLYDDVVAPLRSLLSKPHLVLVPHGLLHHVPLHALHDGSSYMIDSFTVSYAPSASLFALSQERPTIGRGGSLVLGIHDSNAPWILTEAHEVASVVSEPDLRLGADANQQVLKECGPHSRFIHIATHGFFRRDNPMFSAVHLGDGYLSVYDLYNLRLPVELLTLSGCATGLSVVAEGDEIMGLARGLLYAGAQTLLLTLWDVHDRSTAGFMRSFYSHLRDERTSKARALQVAMLELREKYPHPYYWAPFTLVGKTA